MTTGAHLPQAVLVGRLAERCFGGAYSDIDRQPRDPLATVIGRGKLRSIAGRALRYTFVECWGTIRWGAYNGENYTVSTAGTCCLAEHTGHRRASSFRQHQAEIADRCGSASLLDLATRILVKRNRPERAMAPAGSRGW